MVGPTTLQDWPPASGLSGSRYRRLGLHRGLLVTAGTTALALGAGAILGVASNFPWFVWTIAVAVIVFPVLWLRPAWSVYGLVIGAATFESFGLHYPDSLSDRVPFFKSFSSMGSPFPNLATPAEVLILAALLVLVLQRMANRERPLEGGPLFGAIGCYTLVVLAAFLHGVATGGNIRPAIWEVRPLLYLFPVYVLAFNLLRTDRQIKLIFWLFLAAVAFKGIIGSWRYLVTLGGDLTRIDALSSHNSLLGHEDSLFFALFFIFILAMWMMRGGGSQPGFALLLSPPVLLAFLANQRRVGTLVLIVGGLVVCILVYYLVRRRRKLIRTLAVLGAAVVPLYVILLGTADGLLAQPARAVTSIYQPDQRDLSSNSYRVVETENLHRNIAASPLLGQGYGKPITWYIPLPDISDLFGFWDYIPHNTLLWVWLRAGFLGFVIFWFLIGRFIVEALLVARSHMAPYFRGIAIWSIAAALGWLAMGALDQGLADFRSTIILAIIMGLISRLSVWRESQGPASSRGDTEIISARPS